MSRRHSPLVNVNWFRAGEIRFEGYFSGRYDLCLKAAPGEAPYAFVFAGQGAAHPGMFRDQYRRPEIRSLYRRADALVARWGLPPLSSHILAPEGADGAPLLPIQNLSLFVLEVACFDSLLCRGLFPRSLTSHSFGEYAMLVAAGCLPFEEALEIVAFREKISPPPNSAGSMIAVGADRSTVGAWLAGRKFHFSNFNSPTQTVISVAPADVAATEAFLKGKGAKAKILPTPQPYHSPLLLGIKPELRKFLKSRSWTIRPPATPFFSSVLRRWVRPEGFRPEDVLFILENQMIEQVDFIRQVQAVVESGCRRFIEIGPTLLLSGFVRENGGSAAETQWVGEILRKGRARRTESAEPSLKSGVLAVVNEVIGRITGYRIEDISLEDRFQEDLGIDSIKKTEILFTVMERLNFRPEGEVNYSRFSQIKDLVGYLETEAAREDAAAAPREVKFSRHRLVWRMKPLDVPPMATGPEPSPLLVALRAEEALAWDGDPDELAAEVVRQVQETATRQVVIVATDFTSDISQIAEGQIEKWVSGWIPKAVAVVQRALAREPRLGRMAFALVTVGQGSCLTEGFVAFFKALRKELPDLRFKHVHLADAAPNVEALRWIRDELRDPTEVEVRYRDGARYVPRLEPLPEGEAPETADPGVVVAVGGAKGIGLELLDGMASSGKGTYYLCGRSSEAEVTPRALDRLRARGVSVTYAMVDARDGEELTAFLEGVMRAHGRIDRLLLAAGIELSRGLALKSAEEISDELGTKVLSVSHALRAVAANPPARILFFSSVVAWFGNEGQTIYALANALLDQLPRELNRAWGEGTASTILWPPWDGVGMTASAAVRGALQSKGLGLLPADRARELWRRDWPGGKGAEERVFYLDPRDESAYGMPLRTLLPRLLGAWSTGKGLFRFTREMSLATDPYLADHRIDGLPYLPAAQGIAMFLGAAYLNLRAWPRLREFAAAAPLVVGEKGTRLVMDAFPAPEGIKLQLTTELGSFSVTAEPGPFTGGPRATDFPLDRKIPASRVYHPEGLFHGPSFQGITEVKLGPDGRAATTVDHGRLPSILDHGFWGRLVQWLDTAFQLLAVVELERSGSYCLPTGLGELTPYFAGPVTDRIHLSLERFETAGGLVSGEIRVTNDRGDCLLTLDGMRMKVVRVGRARASAAGP